MASTQQDPTIGIDSEPNPEPKPDPDPNPNMSPLLPPTYPELQPYPLPMPYPPPQYGTYPYPMCTLIIATTITPPP